MQRSVESPGGGGYVEWIESILEAQETRNGYNVRNLTSHSTGAQISLPFIRETWMLDALNERPVNSSVRFLLNALAQELNWLS